MSRTLTGAALAEVLSKAVEGAIAGAVERGAQRLATAVDAGGSTPSPPLRGRAGEGASSPLPEGEVGPQGRVRGYGLTAETQSPATSGEFPNPSPAALRASTSPSGRGEGKRSTTLTLTAPNLFAREFGALDTPADPVLALAIDAIRRRSA